MPVSLRDLTKDDEIRFFKGEGYNHHTSAVPKYVSIENRKSINWKKRPEPDSVEGFSGTSGRPPLHTFEGPRAVAPGEITAGQYHPVDLLKSDAGLPAEMQAEIEYEADKVMCKDALAHFRVCRGCRNRVLLELENINAVAGRDGGLALLPSNSGKRQSSEVSGMLSLLGAGIFTVFLIDAFSKFGARLRS